MGHGSADVPDGCGERHRIAGVDHQRGRRTWTRAAAARVPRVGVLLAYQIAVLADAGYEVWAPNLRGYGESSKPPKVADYSMDRLLADIAALIDESGHGEVTLVGHDWGAVQAWMFADWPGAAVAAAGDHERAAPGCMRRELRGIRQLLESWYLFFQILWLPEKLLSPVTTRRAPAWRRERSCRFR